MSSLHPRPKVLFVLVAAAVLALSISACAVFKEGSLQLSQPGGIGNVRVHFELCTDPNVGGCAANEDEGQSQYLLVFSVPAGSKPPATITATPVGAGAPIVYSRNDQVAQSYDEAITSFSQAISEPVEWPPAGSEGVGYLSSVFTEEKGEVREWAVDADFGLPTPADGGPYAGPFALTFASGWREVSPTAPADRPVHCVDPTQGPPEDGDAVCAPEEGIQVHELGTSDLKIGTSSGSTAFIGGKATFAFPLSFASTAGTPPTFTVAATSTLPKAGLKLSDASFAPPAPDPTTHRSAADSRVVTVTVPKNAKPGVYDVTLTAAAAQGGSASQTAQLTVTKPKLKFGAVKLNKSKGTATLAVKVPSAGTLTVAGKGIVKAKKKAQKAKTLKITIKTKGKAKAKLEDLGKSKVKAKIAFKPVNGAVVKKTKRITLKLN